MKDIALHIIGGAVIALLIIPVVWWKIAIVSTIYGLLREQAQHRHQGWVGAFYDTIRGVRWNRLIEGLAWGVGGAIGGLVRW